MTAPIPKKIIIRKLADCEAFSAGDGVLLRELCNPHNQADFSGRYSLAHAKLEPKQSSSPHTLQSHEIYYILAGAGTIHIDSESEAVEPGDTIEIPPGANQWIENNGKSALEFLCIVDPAWRADDESVD